MVEWFSGFIFPLIKFTLVLGILCVILFYVCKGFHNAYTKSWKFFFKYKIRKKPYPEKIISWIFSCIDSGTGWYDAKKIMMVGNLPKAQINETLWIYDQAIIELNKEKGGTKKHGRKFERSYSKKAIEFPTV